MGRENKLNTVSAFIEIEVASAFSRSKLAAEKGNYGQAERISGYIEGLETANRIIRSINMKKEGI